MNKFKKIIYNQYQGEFKYHVCNMYGVYQSDYKRLQGGRIVWNSA